MSLSIDKAIEDAFVSVLENDTYVKANSVPVLSESANDETQGEMVVVGAGDLENMNFGNGGGGDNWKLPMSITSWVYRPDDDDRSKLDGLYESVLSTVKGADRDTLTALLDGLEIQGIVWLATSPVEDQENRYHGKQIQLDIYLEQIPPTT